MEGKEIYILALLALYAPLADNRNAAENGPLSTRRFNLSSLLSHQAFQDFEPLFLLFTPPPSLPRISALFPH
jgi:hypothetical protein